MQEYDALFHPDDRSPSIFVPTAVARGPWDRAALHGGPVAALLAGAAEDHEVDHPVRIVRVTVELLRPVPVEPLTVTVRTVRPGRKVQLVESVAAAGGRDVARSLVLRIRTAGVALPGDVEARPEAPSLPVAPSQRGPTGAGGWDGFHNLGVEMRFVKGSFDTRGPVVVWVRLRQPVLPGVEPTGVQRVTAAADFGNGVSAVLPFDRFAFVNPDLTVALARPPVGEWVCLDAVSRIGGDGTGLAESELYDRDGVVGRAQQSLIIEPR